jgi:hypothetical protein
MSDAALFTAVLAALASAALGLGLAYRQKLGRRWICGDISPEYVELGRQRLVQPLLL